MDSLSFLSSDLVGAPVWAWAMFAIIVVALLAFDLGVLHRKAREIPVGESLVLSAGYIAVRSALPGQIVTIGTAVVSLVNEDSWILANFKETQLRRVRPGDPAEITVDMFPGQVWKGRVAAISPATGSQTALIGPDNATGNFTKIVQRIPVKIMPEKGQDTSMLRPGMSASVTIQPGKRT